MAILRPTWNYARNIGAWAGGSSKALRPGTTWVRNGGAWVPAKLASGGKQHDYGTPQAPNVQMDWYTLFRDIQPTGTPGSVVIGRDDNGLTETPGDPGKTASCSWTNSGGYDPLYDQVQIDWYQNGTISHSTFASPSAGQAHSLAVYHHAANDLSYPADQVFAVLRYYNSDASPAKQYGPSATTSTISY